MEQRVLANPVAANGVKLVLGLFFTAVGILMAADNLRLLWAEDYLRYWPLVLVAIGALKLADPTRRIIGVILIVLGAFLLAQNVDWIDVSIRDLWPLLFIIAGTGMVMRALGMRGRSSTDASSIVAILRSPRIIPQTKDYRGSNIVAFMGGCELDLTGAGISTSPAIIDAMVMWGGIVITVPDKWDVTGEVVPFMGAFEMSTAPSPQREGQLVIRGGVWMGGIEVKRRAS